MNYCGKYREDVIEEYSAATPHGTAGEKYLEIIKKCQLESHTVMFKIFDNILIKNQQKKSDIFGMHVLRNINFYITIVSKIIIYLLQCDFTNVNFIFPKNI